MNKIIDIQKYDISNEIDHFIKNIRDVAIDDSPLTLSREEINNFEKAMAGEAEK